MIYEIAGEGAETGANQNLPPGSTADRQNRSEESTVSPWMGKLLNFVPERMANLILETGYDDEESLMCSVINKSDAQEWIQTLLVDSGYKSTLPKHKWRIDPMAGKLRKLWSACKGEDNTLWTPPPPFSTSGRGATAAGTGVPTGPGSRKHTRICCYNQGKTTGPGTSSKTTEGTTVDDGDRTLRRGEDHYRRNPR